MKLKVTRSSGNVFRDLGFASGEAEHLLVRSDVMIKVQKLIASRRLKQAEVAKILHITQPRVSDLLRGRIDLFSTERSSTCSPAWVFVCGSFSNHPAADSRRPRCHR